MIFLRKPDGVDEQDARVGLLVVSPHPDDESVTTGALLARCAARGTRTAVVACTGGEEGEVVGPGLDAAVLRPYLGAVRWAELAAACRVLGVSRLRTLGYRDSGMAGTPSTLRPDAFCNADSDEATGRLVRVLRELRPQVVVTESAWATYGHPDHVMARDITLRAFAAAGDAAAFPEHGPPWRPTRLYAAHPTADRWGVADRWDEVAARLREEACGAPLMTRWSLDRFGEEPVAARVDVSRHVGVQLAALAHHRTQFPTTSWWLTMPAPARRAALGTLRLARLHPPPTIGEQERDPFAPPRPRSSLPPWPDKMIGEDCSIPPRLAADPRQASPVSG